MCDGGENKMKDILFPLIFFIAIIFCMTMAIYDRKNGLTICKRDDFIKMDTRLSRLEGAVYGKDVYNNVKED